MSAATGVAKKKSRRALPEDEARFVRLHEEIYGRLAEMALILARSVGKTPVLPIRQLTVNYEPSADSGGSSQPVAYHELTYSDGSKGCYDNVKKVSCDGPCPC
jgi:hypothetical protein